MPIPASLVQFAYFIHAQNIYHIIFIIYTTHNYYIGNSNQFVRYWCIYAQPGY